MLLISSPFSLCLCSRIAVSALFFPPEWRIIEICALENIFPPLENVKHSLKHFTAKKKKVVKAY